MVKEQNPCFGCKDRIPPTKEHNGCRPKCEKWAEYEKMHKALMDKRVADNKVFTEYMEFRAESRTRNKAAQAQKRRKK